MPTPQRLPRPFSIALCAMLLGGTAACVAPPPIILHQPVTARRPAVPRQREAVRDRRCEQPARPALTEAEKTRLFDDFDGWQGERRPAGAAADAPVPPPAPAAPRAAPAGCRVSRN